ncbi:MAG: hypothetical protein ACR2PS_01530 [Pseudomonadales bacterium]
MTLEELMKPKPLEYYLGMTAGGEIKISLTQNETAAVLKAHDHGVKALEPQETKLIDDLLSKLKDEIWP